MHEPLYKDTDEWVERLGDYLRKDSPGRWTHPLIQALQKMSGNIRDIYRKFADDKGEGGRASVSMSGGGARYERYLGQLEFQGGDRIGIGVPEQRVLYSMYDGQNRRWFIATYGATVIAAMIGTIEIERLNGGSPERYFVNLTTSGTGLHPAGCLVGFTYGFDRFEPNRGKFFVRTLCFPKETHNTNPAQLINEVPIANTGTRYYSQDVILDATNLAAYDKPNGGDGLRARGNLAIYG